MELKSSGTEQQFEKGAMRDTAVGKPRMSLLSPYVFKRFLKDEGGYYVGTFLLTRDVSMLETLLKTIIEDEAGMEQLCNWLDLGAKRYSAFNWTKGMPISFLNTSRIC